MTPVDYQLLASLVDRNIIQTKSLEVLYVLGKYSANQESTPDQLDPFLAFRDQLSSHLRPAREMICAFGRGQIPCLLRAASEGIDVRVGFENNLINVMGQRADNNAELVKQIAATCQNMGLYINSAEDLRKNIFCSFES